VHVRQCQPQEKFLAEATFLQTVQIIDKIFYLGRRAVLLEQSEGNPVHKEQFFVVEVKRAFEFFFLLEDRFSSKFAHTFRFVMFGELRLHRTVILR
jgi:hypothetical protein